MADTNNKYNFLDYEGLSLFWDNVKKVIEDNELVTATALTDLDARVVQLEDTGSNSILYLDTGSNQDSVSNQIIAISYADLKALRDNAQLVPGQQYRIIDYTCTTVQENTRSAGHVFDIIITADNESILNEEARAIQHEGDSYFANCDLNAWKIWYCLDNDTTRFTWADVTNGKGIIYRMIDEWNNDCPYDFKNIQFKHPNNTSYYPYYYYTFASSTETNNTDNSLNISKNCYSNIIREYIYSSKRKLNQIVFLGSECYSNSFGSDCYSNSFGSGCYSNSFGSGCYSNSFEDYCHGNSLGNYCYSNTFGNKCSSNTFRNSCNNITFGNECNTNTLGNKCQYLKFASDSSASTKYSYYRCNNFGDRCQNILFKGTATASLNAQIQNYNFAQGTSGTEAEYLTIDGVRNRAFETKVAQNSNGEPKMYCEADLIA